jgi:hypothetical protein
MPTRASTIPWLFIAVKVPSPAGNANERPAAPGQAAYARRVVEVRGEAIRRSVTADVRGRELGPPEVVRGCR